MADWGLWTYLGLWFKAWPLISLYSRQLSVVRLLRHFHLQEQLRENNAVRKILYLQSEVSRKPPGGSVLLRLGQLLGSPSYTDHLDSHRFGKNAIIHFSSKLISTARLLTFHTIKESFIIPVVSHLQEMDRKFIITVTASIPLASFPQRRILIKSQNWRGCATFS